jgi:hypothetical protein
MRFLSLSIVSVVAATTLVPALAFADDWVATKLRGNVLQLVGDSWIELKRGDVVPDSRAVRTLKSGRVTFERGAEAIELAGETLIQIVDRTGRQFTTVNQQFGKVTIQADVQNVQHFAVVTPQLAAVVKGTQFTVTSGEHNGKVSVQRGHVAVTDEDTDQTTLLLAGQSAETSDGGEPLEVDGTGELPVIYGPNGKPATNIGQLQTAAAAEARAAALAAGATPQEAAMAAKAARQAAKAEAKETGNSPGADSAAGDSGGGGSNSGGGKKNKD